MPKTKRRIPSEYQAWAIDLRWDGDPWYNVRGPVWQGILVSGEEPAPHLQGCRTALWRTRRAAQNHLRIMKATEAERPDLSFWKRAVVRPVTVKIALRGTP